jgi:translation initiation factor IF-3
VWRYWPVPINHQESYPIATDKNARINGEITAPEVRLIGPNNEQFGIVSLREAMAKTDELDIDLVEIAPQATPPVCKLMDYGKFKYQESKKAHAAKLKQHIIKVKEVKFRPGTDDGDYNIKVRNLIGFLKEGDKAKITLRFRGREMAHQELGLALLKRVEADIKEHAVVEQFPKLEGRQMVMMVGPKKMQVQGPAKAKEAPAAATPTKPPVAKVSVKPPAGAEVPRSAG